MILPDVNVLVNAFRSDAAYHDVCRVWLDEVVGQDARFGISPLSAVVRISTNRRAFQRPSTVSEALGLCDDLLGQPHCEVVAPDRGIGVFSSKFAVARMLGLIS